MCSRATSTAAAVAVAAHRRRDVGQRVVGVGRLDERLVERAGAVGGEARRGGRRRRRRRRRGRRRSAPGGDEGVGDERDPLAPVVVGGQLADDRQDGVGVAEVVGRDVGQALDLAHDVVAEVADEAAVQRRQVGQAGRPVARRAAPRRRRGRPGRSAMPAGSVPVDRRAGRRGRRAWPSGSRPTNDHRLQRSCSTDSSRKPGSSPTTRRKAATGVVRSASSSRQTGTTVWSRARARNSSPGGGASSAGRER